MSRRDHDDVAGEDKARCSTNALRRTVTLGLLTGRFATAGVDESSGEQDTPPPSEMAVAPVESVADTGHRDPSLRVGATPGRSEDPIPRMSGLPHREPPHDPATMPAHDTSSSLAGKSDVRYYREVARLGAQVADALAYAHKRGILHRDIKPPNLILDPLGNIWVTDFGLAKFEEGDDLSQSQDLVGTLRYMAPERFRGISDRRGDLYALGATLYELLTFRPAFEGQDQLELDSPDRERATGAAPAARSQDSPRPGDDRPQSPCQGPERPVRIRAEELAAELRRFVENRPIHSRPIPYYQQFGRWCKRNPWLATANVTAAVLTTILAIVSTVAAFIYHDRNQQAVGTICDPARGR